MKFGRNTNFDKDFLLKNMMGPNCVRIAEELTQKIQLSSEMRILDLGCGTGLTSIFLAKEFGAQVFAADLWIKPTENYERFKKFGFENQIIPIHAEAHELPFAHHYFDAIISIDAYYYFGAEPDYLDKHIVPLIKKHGLVSTRIAKRLFSGRSRCTETLLAGKYEFLFPQLVERPLGTLTQHSH